MARSLIILMFGFLACTVLVSSRPVMGPAPGPSNGTVVQIAPKLAPRACCGFLCMGTCAPGPTSITSTFTCRCSRGCRNLDVTFGLASNQNPGYCTGKYSGNYNVGEWCTQKKSASFNGAFTITSKVGYYIYVQGGGWNYKGMGGSTLTCSSG